MRVKLLKNHPHEFLSRKISQKYRRPYKILEKSMPQIINSSNKNDIYIYIIDFPTAHRLRHKKMTAA